MSAFWVMTVPLGFINILLPRFYAAYLTVKSGVQPDNVNPRQQLEGHELNQKDPDGYIRRAIAAHNNGWEAMNMWVAAVVLARLMGVSTDNMNITAGFWLASRVLYNPAYIFVTSQGTSFVRSGLFAVSVACTQYLLWAAVSKA